MEIPWAAKRLDNSAVALGEMVLISTTVEPAGICCAIPFGPSMTSRTSGVSETIVIIASESLASSASDSAMEMPYSLRGVAFSGVLL